MENKNSFYRSGVSLTSKKERAPFTSGLHPTYKVTNAWGRSDVSPTSASVQQRGFTLIELLVVVLIIGILAAVALPQYQKAVEKSRATQGLVLLKAIYEAQRVYHLANGSYATTFDELTVNIPWTEHTRWSTSADTTNQTRSNNDWSLQLYNSDNGKKAVTIGRLRGKYQGGGFGFYLENPTTDGRPTDQLVCFERTGNGVVFERTAGSYCNKFFNASFVTAANPRTYTMP